MPLRKGDILVCDASDVAIRSRLTSVEALRTFRRRGVHLFSKAGLHAKVVTFPTSAWVGSGNASYNSEHKLIEAAVRVTGEQAKVVHKWAMTLATEDSAVSLEDLKRLQELKLAPYRPGPQRVIVPRELPDEVASITIWWLGAAMSTRQAAAIEKDKPAAVRAAQAVGLPSTLTAVPFEGTTRLKSGDWLITLQSRRVQAPGFVVRITRSQGGGIVWLSRVPVNGKPKFTELLALVPRLKSNFAEIAERAPAKTKAILDTFR